MPGEQVLTEWLEARADCRKKREAFRQARTEYEAARKTVEELGDELEHGQGTLPFDDGAKSKPTPKPRKPHGSGEQAAGVKSDAG